MVGFRGRRGRHSRYVLADILLRPVRTAGVSASWVEAWDNSSAS
nr:MAG TPA: hypothetical protein [Bacteriophage sp.]